MLVLANEDRRRSRLQAVECEVLDAFGRFIPLPYATLQTMMYASCFFSVVYYRDIDIDISKSRSALSLSPFSILSYSSLSFIFIAIVIMPTASMCAFILIGGEAIAMFIGNYVNRLTGGILSKKKFQLYYNYLSVRVRRLFLVINQTVLFLRSF